ncbi:DUF6479 family protein [Streptomyces sp. SDr-06]|uniref:DUF6479 family protein n=1 Tax=Streptomyces sp. SDr-06 TaxID=2267702 RepID=UPI001CB8BDB1
MHGFVIGVVPLLVGVVIVALLIAAAWWGRRMRARDRAAGRAHRIPGCPQRGAARPRRGCRPVGFPRCGLRAGPRPPGRLRPGGRGGRPVVWHRRLPSRRCCPRSTPCPGSGVRSKCQDRGARSGIAGDGGQGAAS